MSTKKKSAQPTPRRPTPSRANLKIKDAKDTRKFLVVLAVGTLLLTVFMYFIFMAANR